MAMSACDRHPHLEGSNSAVLRVFIFLYPHSYPEKGLCNKIGLSSVSPCINLCPSWSFCLAHRNPLEGISGDQFTTHAPTVSSVHAHRLFPGNVCVERGARSSLLSAGKASPPPAPSAGSASCLLLGQAGDCWVCSQPCGPKLARPH